jgi:uncharacterized protein (DUF433 family)
MFRARGSLLLKQAPRKVRGVQKRRQRYVGTGATIFPMIDWSSCAAVERHPGRVSGAWVFKGTRVPVSALFENIEDGATLRDFLDWFPGVEVDQARAVLEHVARSAVAAE